MTAEQIQEKLQALGLYAGEIDGKIGRMSKTAIRAFQRGAGLVVDGIAGPKTQKKLASAVADIALPSDKIVPVNGISLDARSIRNLEGVHADLVKVVRRAAEISDIDFTITEGLRSVARQRQLVAKGASKTMRSRHITGHAVDVAIKVGGKIRWDWPLYESFSKVMKKAAKDVGVKIKWGGDWTSFKDGPHYQLTWANYPA